MGENLLELTISVLDVQIRHLAKVIAVLRDLASQNLIVDWMAQEPYEDPNLWPGETEHSPISTSTGFTKQT